MCGLSNWLSGSRRGCEKGGGIFWFPDDGYTCKNESAKGDNYAIIIMESSRFKGDLNGFSAVAIWESGQDYSGDPHPFVIL